MSAETIHKSNWTAPTTNNYFNDGSTYVTNVLLLLSSSKRKDDVARELHFWAEWSGDDAPWWTRGASLRPPHTHTQTHSVGRAALARPPAVVKLYDGLDRCGTIRRNILYERPESEPRARSGSAGKRAFDRSFWRTFVRTVFQSVYFSNNAKLWMLTFLMLYTTWMTWSTT